MAHIFASASLTMTNCSATTITRRNEVGLKVLGCYFPFQSDQCTAKASPRSHLPAFNRDSSHSLWVMHNHAQPCLSKVCMWSCNFRHPKAHRRYQLICMCNIHAASKRLKYAQLLPYLIFLTMIMSFEMGSTARIFLVSMLALSNQPNLPNRLMSR